jgi:hypothetical protein
MKVKPFAFILTLLMAFASCAKYDDGPAFSLYSKKERATGNWRFEKVIENGVDKTEDYANQTVNMLKNGDVFWTQGYYDGYWNPYGIGGTWSFASNKEQIEMRFTQGVSQELVMLWDIKRMAYADLQLVRYEGDVKIEWGLWHY